MAEGGGVKMADEPGCLNCGEPLAGDARLGFCPRCLFLQASTGLAGLAGGVGERPESEDGQPAVAPARSAVPLPQSFGDYEGLEEIGRGGMGVVYRGRQRSLDRVVAIKMMNFGPGASPELTDRFRAEAVAAGSLHHPNIVAIHEVGRHEGRDFYVMDFVEGQSLARLAGNQPLPAWRAAGYLNTVAEAVHYAHEQGLLHRDLKPSNILIDAQDQPHVVDFGLARRLDGDSDLTVTGQVLGSPHYLPPEQASGQRSHVSRRTDVYALGATLYHLLTGRPPFQAESLAQTLDLVLHSEPVAPRLLNPGIPRDLETICLKCLEKEPQRRYATARELAEELARYQAGEPIRARPLSVTAKALRWCRRNPALAGTGAVAALAVVLGFVGVLWQLRRAEAAELVARQGQYVSDMNLAQHAVKATNVADARERLERYIPGKSEKDLRGFEWRYLWQECQIAGKEIGWLDGPIRDLEVSPNGEWLAAGSDPGSVKLWNLKTSERLSLTGDGGVLAFLTFSPDSRLLLFTDQSVESESLGTIAVWDTQTRRRLAPIKDRASVGTLGFSPDGKWFWYGMGSGFNDRKLVVLDFARRQKLREVTAATGFQGDSRHGLDCVFATDGQRAIFSENEPCCSIAVCDFASGGPLRHFPQCFPLTPDNLADVASFAGKLKEAARPIDVWLAAQLSPETKAAVEHYPGESAGSTELGAALLQDLNKVLTNASTYVNPEILSGIALRSETRNLLALNPTGSHRARLNRLWLEDAYPLEFSKDPFPGHREAITAMALHPDGRTLATGAGLTDTSIQLWELPSFRPVRKLTGHKGWITALRFSPDGQTLASAGADRSIRLWDLRAQRQRTAFESIPQIAWRLCFAPDGRALFSGANDGWIHRWPLEAAPVRPRPWRCEAGLSSLTTALEGNQFAGLRDGAAWIGAVGEDAPPRPIAALGTNLTCLLLAPNGRILFAGSEAGEVQVWSVEKQKILRRLPGPAEPVRVLEQDRLGHILLVVHERMPEIETEGLVALCRVRAWRTTDWQVQKSWDFRAGTSRFAVSPDGHYCAVGHFQGTVQLWSLLGGSQPDFLPFPRTIRGLAFSPDGQLLAASSDEGYVKIWETATLTGLREFRVHTSAREDATAAHELSFSPGGRRLAALGEGEEAVKLLDVATWRDLISLSLPGGSLREVFFSADGNRLTARSWRGDVLSWWVPSFEEIARRESQRARLK